MGRIYDLPEMQDFKQTDWIPAESQEHGTVKIPVAALYGGVYDGQDLTVLFADEIADAGNPWKWIQNRCYDRNYAGLRAKDYIPFEMNGYTIVAQIAGLEPYLGCTDVELAGHIDFISRNTYPETVQWNTSNNTQGNADNASPYMVSNLKAWYDSIADALPTELYNVILNKRSYMESRYTSGSTLTESTAGAWCDLGKLWAPHEQEVFGYRNWSGVYAGYNGTWYEIFHDGRSRAKKHGEGSTTRRAWWECDVRDGSSTNACNVHSNGAAGTTSTSDTSVAPVLGFRIGYEA